MIPQNVIRAINIKAFLTFVGDSPRAGAAVQL